MMGQTGTKEMFSAVVDNRIEAANDLRAVQIPGHEPTPPPLILQFIIDILRVGPLQIQVDEPYQFGREIGDQYEVFVFWSERHHFSPGQRRGGGRPCAPGLQPLVGAIAVS